MVDWVYNHFYVFLFTAVTDVNTKIQEQNQQSNIHHLPSINEIEIIEIHNNKVIQAGRLIQNQVWKSFQHLDYNNQIKKWAALKWSTQWI